MFKFVLLIILGYFAYKIFKSMLMPKQEEEKVRGRKSESAKTRTKNNKRIEDADFEEIE